MGESTALGIKQKTTVLSKTEVIEMVREGLNENINLKGKMG